MSESAILTIVASIVTGFVTIATMVVGLFTLWIKLKYEKRTSTETILKGQQETQEQVKQVVAQAQDSVNENVRINTEVTKAGIKVAARDNKEAVAAVVDAKDAVTEVKDKTEAMAADVSKKLNGGLDHSIAKAVEPIKVTLQEHQMVISELTEEHAKNMAEVQKQFKEMSDYIHRRHHEILDKFSTTAYGVQAILEILKGDREGRKHAETRVD